MGGLLSNFFKSFCHCFDDFNFCIATFKSYWDALHRPFLDRKFRPGIWFSHNMDPLWCFLWIACEGRRCRKPSFSYTWNLRKWPQRIHPSGCWAPIYINELRLLGFLGVSSVGCQQKTIFMLKLIITLKFYNLGCMWNIFLNLHLFAINKK